MWPRVIMLSTLCAWFVAGPDRPAAGDIHIRYGPEAPERMAAANLRYYEGILKLDEDHPVAFEREHPFYAEMIRDPEMTDRLVSRWEAHPQRFEYWHDCLWKFLDGYVVSHRGPSVSNGGHPSSGGVGPVGPAEREGGTVTTVPEPSSGLLVLIAGLVGGGWAACRRWLGS